MDNLFAGVPPTLREELIDVLVATSNVRLERIISTAHRTPPGEWYDQDTNEWVVVLRGSAGLRFEDQEEIVVLQPGDWADITAHRRHRVEWTDPAQPTIWLALHYRADSRPTDPAGSRRIDPAGSRRTTRRAFSS